MAMAGLGQVLPARFTMPPISTKSGARPGRLSIRRGPYSPAEVGVESRLCRTRPAEVVLAGDGRVAGGGPIRRAGGAP
jgi:hypothetical protein